MNDPGLTFVTLAALFVLCLAGLVLFMVRRYQLRRTLGTADASLCTPGKPWRMGVCRYQDSDLEWFRLMSLSPRARFRFRRSALVLVGRRAPTESERTKVQQGSVIVTLSYEGRELLMAMKFDVYAGLSSWLEAGPVVGIGTWR
jgi:hypothetical protein